MSFDDAPHGCDFPSESLLSMVPEDLVMRYDGVDPKEARRLLSTVHRTGSVPTRCPSGVRRSSFDRIVSDIHMRVLRRESCCPSSCDPFVKYGFRTCDGRLVETVRIPLAMPGRFVVCVSTQTGCAMGCAFCATARLGTGRNLAAWEIVDQVRQVRGELPAGGRVHGVVFQGMGEPLANAASVIRSVRVLTDSSLQSVDGRAITVSSCGLLNPLPRILEALPKTRLGISIGHAQPERRVKYMPVEASNPLSSVLDIAADHSRVTGIATMLSYTMLGGENDSECDADALLGLAHRYAKRAGMPPRVSLIAYNSIGADGPFVPSTPDRVQMFRHRLGSVGIPVVRRYSGGADVCAACGQLGMQMREQQMREQSTF